MRKLKDYVVYYKVAGRNKPEIMEYTSQGINADAVKRIAREDLYPNFTLVDVKLLSNVAKKNSIEAEKINRIEKYMACNI